MHPTSIASKSWLLRGCGAVHFHQKKKKKKKTQMKKIDDNADDKDSLFRLILSKATSKT